MLLNLVLQKVTSIDIMVFLYCKIAERFVYYYCKFVSPWISFKSMFFIFLDSPRVFWGSLHH